MIQITYPDGYVHQYACDATMERWDRFYHATSAWNGLDWVAHAIATHERSMRYLHMCADPMEPRPFTDYPDHEEAMLNVDDAFDAMQV